METSYKIKFIYTRYQCHTTLTHTITLPIPGICVSIKIVPIICLSICTSLSRVITETIKHWSWNFSLKIKEIQDWIRLRNLKCLKKVKGRCWDCRIKIGHLKCLKKITHLDWDCDIKYSQAFKNLGWFGYFQEGQRRILQKT